MAHFFKYINLYAADTDSPAETRRRTGIIRAESESLCTQFMKTMRFYRNEQCMQLNVAMTECLAAPLLEPASAIREFEHYRTLCFPFDFAAYQAIPAAQKNAYWLRVIHQAIQFAGTAWNWDLAYCSAVTEQIAVSKISAAASQKHIEELP